jgi:hypothetical protein
MKLKREACGWLHYVFTTPPAYDQWSETNETSNYSHVERHHGATNTTFRFWWVYNHSYIKKGSPRQQAEHPLEQKFCEYYSKEFSSSNPPDMTPKYPVFPDQSTLLKYNTGIKQSNAHCKKVVTPAPLA